MPMMMVDGDKLLWSMEIVNTSNSKILRNPCENENTFVNTSFNTPIVP
jgi:hypothetical protein